MSKILDAVDTVNDARKLVKAIGMAAFSLRLDQRSPLCAMTEAVDDKLDQARAMLMAIVATLEGEGEEVDQSEDCRCC